MAYSENELLNKDMDWFVKISPYYIHAASAGGMVPTVIYENDKKNKLLTQTIKRLPFLFKEEEIGINPFLRQILHLEEQQKELSFILDSCNISYENNPIDTYIKRIYCYSFIKFARKGFFSFDKTNINNFEDAKYHLVAWPCKTTDLELSMPTCSPLKELDIIKIYRETNKEIEPLKREKYTIELVNLVNNLSF
ncbi:hypothetical protein SAMN05444405_12151 [Bacteroides luti]|uniref:Uncharacterized protein n=1 Tax=Bacteroides luti TaxID=1297750 RepID=A0A1M5GM44_9BACE|nr:hypothetical protein [Bacteroides luti]SHG04809.1 hypothetical protein SAMN05444405_12151 [Bacteroides luti]